jgi:hypothetical protein
MRLSSTVSRFDLRMVAATGEAMTWVFVADLNRTAGCLAAGWPSQGSTEAQTNLSFRPSIALLERFGVLIAASSDAHRIWPTLPVADTQELALAQLLLTQAQP